MRLRGTGGFTLLEVIVSLVVLAADLVAVLGAFTASMAATGAAENRTIATMLLNEKLEELKKEPLVTAGEDEGDFGEEFEDYRWNVEVIESGTPGLVYVVVTVSWLERGKETELSIRTLLRGGEAVQEKQEQAQGERGMTAEGAR